MPKTDKKGYPLACDPIAYKDFKIYTATNTFSWRVLRKGNAVDRKSSWKNVEVEEAWKKVLHIIATWD